MGLDGHHQRRASVVLAGLGAHPALAFCDRVHAIHFCRAMSLLRRRYKIRFRKKSSWSNVDSGELRLLLNERFGGPGQYNDRSKNPNKLWLPLGVAISPSRKMAGQLLTASLCAVRDGRLHTSSLVGEEILVASRVRPPSPAPRKSRACILGLALCSICAPFRIDTDSNHWNYIASLAHIVITEPTPTEQHLASEEFECRAWVVGRRNGYIRD
jgi:hypothetical protein